MQFFDYQALKRGFNKTAKTYDVNAEFSRNTGAQLLERLSGLKIKPKRILDIGAGTGHLGQSLQKLYPKAKIFNLDLAEQRLRIAQKKDKHSPKQNFICADAHALPFSDQSFDLIVSNLCWHWMDHLGQAIYEAKRILKIGGTLLFTTVGPDTLRELNAAFYAASNNPHINRFFDMHDVGDALLKAGFADPVMDIEYASLKFKNLDALFKMLRKTGEVNYLKLRQRGLSRKSVFQEVRKQYKNFKDTKTYPATFELVFGYAWRPKDRDPTPVKEVSVLVSNVQRKK